MIYPNVDPLLRFLLEEDGGALGLGTLMVNRAPDDGFNPLTITGLKEWLDAQKLSSLWQDSALTTPVTADAQPIGGWVDQSGTGNTPIQATAGNRPTYAVSGINGHPSLSYPTELNAVTLSKTFGAALVQPNTLFVVAQSTAAVSTDFYLDGPAGSRPQFIELGNGNNYRIVAGSLLDGGAVNLNPHIFTIIFNGASSKLYRDGGTAIISGNAGAQNIGGVFIGNNNAQNGAIKGYFGELMIYNAAVSLDNINALGRYLSAKWGIAWNTAS